MPFSQGTVQEKQQRIIAGFPVPVPLGGPRAFFDPPRPLCFWFSSVTDLKLTPSSQSGDM